LLGLAPPPRFTVWGVRDVNHAAARVPTIAITDRTSPPQSRSPSFSPLATFVSGTEHVRLEVSERLDWIGARLCSPRPSSYNTVDELQAVKVAR